MRLALLWLFFAAFSSALSVNLTAPLDGFIFSSAAQSFSFSSDGNFSSCALYVNASGWNAVANSSASPLAYTLPSDGFFVWAVACSDGNQTVFSSNRSFRLDTAAPSVPGNLSVFGNTPANVFWTASLDASGVTYELLRNGSLVFNGSAVSFSENIPASTTHNYSVRAVDAAGWSSAWTSVLAQGPTALVLLNLSVAASASGAVFSWTASFPANSSVSYGNGTAVFGTVSNPSVSTSARLSVAGLLPVTNYSYTVTACTSAVCTNSSGFFRTLASSYPLPSFVQASGSTAGASVVFSAFWSDSQALSHYVFSTNVSGSWVNSTYAFSGSYSNHTMAIPSAAVTVSWLFYANNSQNAFNQTSVQNLPVVVPAATPTITPTSTPTLIPSATPFPTIPPELVRTAATATPTTTPASTIAPSTTPSPVLSAVATLGTVLQVSGRMTDLVVDAQSAQFALSPTGLVIGVSGSKALVVLSSNFSNAGKAVTVLLRAKLNGSSGSFELFSQPVTVEEGQSIVLQTVDSEVPPGEYEVAGQIVAVDSDQVVDSRLMKIRIASSFSGYAAKGSSPALAGFLVVFLAVLALIAGRLHSVNKEFA